jgi:hypothetical protein
MTRFLIESGISDEES